MAELFLWLLAAHLFADWFLQTNWQAKHKTSLLHPASWLHSSIHLLLLAFLLPFGAALLVALSHLLIDTRVPLTWWRERMGQTKDPADPVFIPMAMWQDQAAHILVLITVASICS